MDLGFVLRPLSFGLRMHVPRRKSWGGRGGSVLAAIHTSVTWLTKLLIVGYAVVAVVVAYTYLGVAWLVSPVVAAAVAYLQDEPPAPRIERYQATVVRAVHRLNRAIRSSLRR